MNIVLNIDDEIGKKVHKIARRKNTTLAAMVKDYLTSVSNADGAKRREHVARLKDSCQKMSRDMGPRKWTREDLHAR